MRDRPHPRRRRFMRNLVTARLHVAYDATLLDWQLGKNHPTNPVRAKNAVDLITKRLGASCVVDPITHAASVEELSFLHDASYVRETLAGYNSEWAGQRPDLGRVASHMFAGTTQLMDGVLSGEVKYGFAPQGAKHHAMADHGSGFCVFNDFAHVATLLAIAGHRVMYFDTDAHHGDGVEALTRTNEDVLTFSVHDESIFPGTGHTSDPHTNAWNAPLARGAGDRELIQATLAAFDLADEFDPTVILFAIGGDGYVDDPLSTLEYTHHGYVEMATQVGVFARDRDLPVIMGGAGGYLPETATPRVWANVVETVYTFASV